MDEEERQLRETNERYREFIEMEESALQFRNILALLIIESQGGHERELEVLRRRIEQQNRRQEQNDARNMRRIREMQEQSTLQRQQRNRQKS